MRFLLMLATIVLLVSEARGFGFMTAMWTDGDPCGKSTPPAGTVCTGGAIFAGSYNGYRYMTTPAGCGAGTAPTCGGDDTLFYLAWGASGTATGITSLTDGAANTTALAAGYADTAAAKYCEALNFLGYSDWFLPAQTEAVNTLYTNRALIPGLVLDGSNYWTSSESTSTKAFLIQFKTATQGNTGKTNQMFIRCMRKY